MRTPRDIARRIVDDIFAELLRQHLISITSLSPEMLIKFINDAEELISKGITL